MHRAIVVATFLFFAHSARAEWSFVNKVDDFTDKQVHYAVYEDADHRLQVSRQGETVWIFLTRKKVGTFDPNGVVEFRVDKNNPRTIDPVKDRKMARVLGNPTFQWEPATIGFLVWHGKENEGCGYINELLEGQEFKMRYQINSMQREVLSISLAGAKEALINGLSLTVCGKQAK